MGPAHRGHEGHGTPCVLLPPAPRGPDVPEGQAAAGHGACVCVRVCVCVQGPPAAASHAMCTCSHASTPAHCGTLALPTCSHFPMSASFLCTLCALSSLRVQCTVYMATPTTTTPYCPATPPLPIPTSNFVNTLCPPFPLPEPSGAALGSQGCGGHSAGSAGDPWGPADVLEPEQTPACPGQRHRCLRWGLGCRCSCRHIRPGPGPLMWMVHRALPACLRLEL